MAPCCRFPFPGAWSIDSVRNGFATSTIKNDSDISSRSSLKRILRPGILVAPVERPLPSRTLAKVRQPCSVTRRVKDKQKSAHSLTPKSIEKNSVGKTKRVGNPLFCFGYKAAITGLRGLFGDAPLHAMGIPIASRQISMRTDFIGDQARILTPNQVCSLSIGTELLRPFNFFMNFKLVCGACRS